MWGQCPERGRTVFEDEVQAANERLVYSTVAPTAKITWTQHARVEEGLAN